MKPKVQHDYAPLLRQWSRELLASDLSKQLKVNGANPDWLGSDLATPDEISVAEARLGLRLPPSYRDFLLMSNGWGPLSSFVHRLRPIEEVELFITENANTVDVWGDSDDGGLADVEYFCYGDDGDENLYFRGKHLRHAVQISDGGDGDLLLNPCAITPDGEWECWFLASWIPGARRYPSFAHWLVHEFRSFRTLNGIRNVEPPLPDTPIFPPDLKRKM